MSIVMQVKTGVPILGTSTQVLDTATSGVSLKTGGTFISSFGWGASSQIDHMGGVIGNVQYQPISITKEEDETRLTLKMATANKTVFPELEFFWLTTEKELMVYMYVCIFNAVFVNEVTQMSGADGQTSSSESYRIIYRGITGQAFVPEAKATFYGDLIHRESAAELLTLDKLIAA